jgi:hypothetical protein
VDGAPAGTYIFQYKVTESMCSLVKDDVLLAYVVLVPDMSNVSVDTLICTNTTITYASAADVQAYLSPAVQEFLTEWGNTGLTATYPASWPIEFSPSANDDHKTDVAAFKYDSVKFAWTAPKSSYKCITNFKATIKVTIADSIVIDPGPDTAFICLDDLAGLAATPQTPYDYWNIHATGSWATVPASGVIVGGHIDFANMNMSSGTSGGMFYDFTFTYNSSCKPGVTANKTALRVIKIINGPIGGDPMDEYVFCKQKPYDSIKLYEHFYSPTLYPYITATTWKFIGNTPTGGGTAASPMADNTAKGTYTAEYYVKKELIGTGVPYYFRFKLGSTASCMAGDSGVVKITAILPTGGVPEDGRVQICRKDNTPFDMNNYLMLGSTTNWTNVHPSTPPPTVTGGIFASAEQLLDTYVFGYNEPSTSGCGGARSGNLTVKVTDNLVYSDEITVYYCVETLPTTVNLFSLLGIAPVPGDGTGWVNVPVGPDPVVSVTGDVLTMSDIYNLGQKTYTFEFTPHASSACVTGKLTVHITLGSTLP